MNNKRTFADLLENWLDSTSFLPDGRVYKIKGFVERVKDLKVYVYAGDHEPPHFHVVSTQRKIDAKFHLYSRELIADKSNRITTKDIKKIKALFEVKGVEKMLLDEYKKMQIK